MSFLFGLVCRTKASAGRIGRGGLFVAVLGAQQCPDKAAEFASNGHLGFVALESAAQEFDKARVQSILSLPAQSANGRGLALLAAGEFFADFGRDGVVLGTFGE